MGYIDDQFPLTDEPTNFLAVMAKHLANRVPTSSWVSLVNVGLSLTHFVSENRVNEHAPDDTAHEIRASGESLAAEVRQAQANVDQTNP